MILLTAAEARRIAEKAVSLGMSEELDAVLENIRIASENKEIFAVIKQPEPIIAKQLKILGYVVTNLQDGESCVYW